MATAPDTAAVERLVGDLAEHIAGEAMHRPLPLADREGTVALLCDGLPWIAQARHGAQSAALARTLLPAITRRALARLRELEAARRYLVGVPPAGTA